MTRVREHNGATICIVEDNKRLAQFLARAFGEEGYKVHLSNNGADALEQLRATSYSLVILDWMLPGLDGLSVCREVRVSGIRVPILMLSARTDTVERIAALDAGADDFVTKPFDLGELLARARALLRRGTGTAILQTGPLSLFLAERRATLAGKAVDFTQIEFKLIALLARHSGTNISRAKILTKVWETTDDINSNVIEVQVRNIRDKLGPFAPMLQTVRGAGYRLVPPETQEAHDPSLQSEPSVE